MLASNIPLTVSDSKATTTVKPRQGATQLGNMNQTAQKRHADDNNNVKRDPGDNNVKRDPGKVSKKCPKQVSKRPFWRSKKGSKKGPKMVSLEVQKRVPKRAPFTPKL